MSTKVAVIIGDYSNGWADAWIVQQPTSIVDMKQLLHDKRALQDAMNKALNMVVEAIETNPKINPILADEPCCERFAEWAIEHLTSDIEFCGRCGKPVSADRRRRFQKTT